MNPKYTNDLCDLFFANITLGVSNPEGTLPGLSSRCYLQQRIRTGPMYIPAAVPSGKCIVIHNHTIIDYTFGEQPYITPAYTTYNMDIYVTEYKFYT